MVFSTRLVSLLTLASVLYGVLAHPGEIEPILTARELQQRKIATIKRQAVARNCDGAIAAYNAQRRAKRAMDTRRREKARKQESSSVAATSTASASAPHYTELQNNTCLLTPEAEEGPYYIHEELVRTDIRDGMDGIPLVLDIGVMDVTTCQPMENVVVDIWHCNATGIYSGFISSESSNTDNSSTGTSSMTAAPSGSSGGAAPTGSMSMSMSAPGGGGGGAGGENVATDNQTFGRGAYATDSNGIVEFSTVFPGFYSGRAVHVHTIVLTNYTVNSNGTLGLEAGEVRHVGQLLFEESWTQLLVAQSPYNQETITRTTNDEDRVYADESVNGHNATVEMSWLGDDITNGVLAYATLGIDPSASYELASVSYHSGNATD